MKNERTEKANEKKAFEDRSNNNVSQKKPIISLLVLFLETHRKRRSGLISRARPFWTLPSGEEVRRVERKERRDFGERERAHWRKFEYKFTCTLSVERETRDGGGEGDADGRRGD